MYSYGEKLVEATKSINQNQPVNEEVHEMQSIPLLDLTDPEFPRRIVETFKKIGFAIITNHGLSPARIDEAFMRSKQFFMLDSKTKKAIVFNPNVNRGYMGAGQQILDEKEVKNDKKETLDLGHPKGLDELQYYPKIDHFDEFFASFYEDMFKIHVGLGLPKGFVVQKCTKDFYGQTLRLLYYPQVSYNKIKQTGIGRAGAHSDYGTLTLLIQKPGFGQNGLRALSSTKQWVKVEPPDYSMVINLGDLFQHWSNDVLVSTIHKVQVDEKVMSKLQSKELESALERQTIVMFCDPDSNQMFECLPNCGPAKYPPIDGKMYVLGRIKSTVDHKM